MRHWKWFNIPNFTTILRNSSVGREETRTCDTFNAHLCPFFVVSVSSISKFLSLNVWVKINCGNVVISAFHQVINDSVNNLGVSEVVIKNSIEYSLKSTSNMSNIASRQLFSPLVNSINKFSEDEHVLLSNLLCNFNIGSIHGTNNNGSIHNEFHV